MKQIKADLLHTTPLAFIAKAIRQSRQLQELSDSELIDDKLTLGKDDNALIKRVGFNMNHKSVLEHSMITYEFTCPRFVLQELARHRIGISMTIKSSRYTLKELKKEESFIEMNENLPIIKFAEASKYVYIGKNEKINSISVAALEGLRQGIQADIKNDVAKACMPESYLTTGQITFNLRSLENFVKLRLEPAALWEIRLLAYRFIEQLPEDYRNLLFTNDRIFKYFQKINKEIG